MRLENEQGWIKIEFDHYAEEGCYMRDGLFDVHNSVELGQYRTEKMRNKGKCGKI